MKSTDLPFKAPPPITDVVAPLGPNARAMLDGRPSCGCGCGALAGYCFEGAARAWPKQQPSPRPTVLNLIADIAAGIRVLRTYGVEITEAQVMERANNIAAGLEGNYRITGMGDL